MRRLIALLLMLIVPLQFAWSAAAAVHHPADDAAALLAFHHHDGDHDHDHAAQDESAGSPAEACHHEDGHAGGHFHPTFLSVLTEHDLLWSDPGAHVRPDRASDAFTSHTPPLFDRPPSVPR